MIDIMDYGFPASALQEKSDALLPARVTEVHRGVYKVICEQGEFNATLRGTLINDPGEAGYPAVGDYAWIDFNGGQPVIRELLPRKSKFSRPDYSGHAVGYVKSILEQVVAANFDAVFIMCSLNYDFNVSRIERYLAAAWQSGGTPVVVLTKADLCADFAPQMAELRRITTAVDVVPISSKTGEGLDKLSPYLGQGKTIVFLGSSGVGKSSLVNRLAGRDIMRVKDIREDDSKGRHSTTHRQLIRLDDGTMIIDTPGMRELSLWDASEGLGTLFSDVEELITQCRFSNCRHQNEPGCAIRTALRSGALTPERWQDYQKLKQEAQFTDNRAAFMRDKRAKMKNIAMFNKKH